MEPTRPLLCRVERRNERGLRRVVARLDRQIDTHEVLVLNLPGADCEVADLRVAHHAGGEADGEAARVKIRVIRPAVPEAVHHLRASRGSSSVQLPVVLHGRVGSRRAATGVSAFTIALPYSSSRTPQPSMTMSTAGLGELMDRLAQLRARVGERSCAAQLGRDVSPSLRRDSFS